MDEQEARKKMERLVKLAMEAGKYGANPDSLFVKLWNDKGMEIVTEILSHLTSPCSGRADYAAECEQCEYSNSCLGPKEAADYCPARH